MALPSFLARIAGWLRAGYPEGVPEHDYYPLLALLRKELSDDEIVLIAEELSFSPTPGSAAEIRKAISNVTRTTVGDHDIARVRSRLAAGGWPLAPPDRDLRQVIRVGGTGDWRCRLRRPQPERVHGQCFDLAAV
jgi:Protein of unknown function (DUF3349)